jgi:hypothetical protein
MRQAASSSPYAGITRIRFKRFPRRLFSPAVSQPLDEAPLGTAAMVAELGGTCQERFLITFALKCRAGPSGPLASSLLPSLKLRQRCGALNALVTKLKLRSGREPHKTWKVGNGAVIDRDWAIEAPRDRSRVAERGGTPRPALEGPLKVCQNYPAPGAFRVSGKRIGKAVQIRRVPNAVKGTVRAYEPTGFCREGAWMG